MKTLVVDIGMDIVGIYSVDDDRYISYRRSDIQTAIERIREADEVVTYNGSHYDLMELGKLAGFDSELPLKGMHHDMRSIIWSDRIWGSGLLSTYSQHFYDHPSFPDTHEGSNECDTYMTFKLWELWKQGKLKVVDGHPVQG